MSLRLTVEPVKRAASELDAVLGSLASLPEESPDLDAEIDAAKEEQATQRMRRLDRSH
jgi:hypothetical protein